MGTTPDAYPRRPPRIVPFANEAPIYFVTFCTIRRKNALATPAIHTAFRAFSTRAQDQHGVAVGRYVIMPDHIHLFVSLSPAAASLSSWVGSLKRHLSRTWVKAGGRLPLWQQSFFDHLLRSDESYQTKWTYVWQNPVRAHLCLNAEDWPYAGEIVPLSHH
ncbi:REP-associated tyrosine transposase [Actomonas aquatica]|uniref:Transposase n=1 Tax=Actomonas aquatica TaxID=2866162 RepID=A0ABZ1C867_9BACT|nr:transposase [Opitutus sp. WL0086]WRQ87517.1 transposase [Opitutus sp. WL0086]